MLEDLIRNLPKNPGVYIMYNKDNSVIYVGKAKNLKNRVTQYFRNNSSHTVKVRAMVAHIERFEYIITKTEFEALVLECTLIKQHMPKYNILLKDDKAHPYIKVTYSEQYPRIVLARRVLPGGDKYFGPYISSNVVYSTIDALKSIFKIRSCSGSLSKPQVRPCLNYQIDKCSAPCCGTVSREEYLRHVNEAVEFLEGKDNGVFERLDGEMRAAAENLDFEKAAVIRDKLAEIKQIRDKQTAVTVNMSSSDIIAAARNDNNVCVQVFFQRDGKIIGRQHYFMTESSEARLGDIISGFIKQYYVLQGAVPPSLYIQCEIEDTELISRWLTEKCGRKVNIAVPKRGDKLKYVKMAEKNAVEELKLKLLSDDRSSKKISDVLFELKNTLSLKKAPVRIEAYDISNISGADNIGVCVVYENGQPKKSDYRTFNIRSVDGQDDYMSMREVLYRRLSNGIEGEKGFTPLPDLIILDGGAGHLSTVMEVMRFLKLDIPVFGAVKDDKHKTRGVVSVDGEITISRVSALFRFIHQMQEEVHRFAINTHRKKRSKSMTDSELRKIKGVGEKKQIALLTHFKSIEAIKEATADELAAAQGIDSATAAAVYNFYHSD